MIFDCLVYTLIRNCWHNLMERINETIVAVVDDVHNIKSNHSNGSISENSNKNEDLQLIINMAFYNYEMMDLVQHKYKHTNLV